MAGRIKLCFAIGSIVFGLSAAAARADELGERCSGVLKYTGRESSVFMSKNIASEYASWKSSSGKSTNATANIPVDDIPVSGSYGDKSDSSASSVSQSDKRDEYFRAVDSVFGPSVEAWKACITAADKGAELALTLQPDGKSLVIQITNHSGTAMTFGGVHAPTGIDCKRTSVSRPNGLMPREPLTYECHREPRVTRAATLSITVSNKLLEVPLPAISGEPRRAGGADDFLVEIGGSCNEFNVYAPAPFKRTILVGNVTMIPSAPNPGGDLRPTQFWVSVNGVKVINEFHTEKYSGRVSVDVDPFVPILTHVGGGYSPGSCGAIKAGVWLPR